MNQASRHVVLIHFTHEEIKAHASQCFTQGIRWITKIPGSRTQFFYFIVRCLLHNVRVLQLNSNLKHCSVDSFLVVGYKWHIILITHAYFQRKDFTPILCQCYFNVWHYISGCILLYEKILGKNVCMYLFLPIHSNLGIRMIENPRFRTNLNKIFCYILTFTSFETNVIARKYFQFPPWISWMKSQDRCVLESCTSFLSHCTRELISASS